MSLEVVGALLQRHWRCLQALCGLMQVTPLLLLRLPSMLYLLGHLGHQFPSTTLQTLISEARLPWGEVESRPELQPGGLRLSPTKAEG